MYEFMLYIHVPFCRRKCRYCAFFSEPVSRKNSFPALYLDTLTAEMAARMPAAAARITTIFIGGGTPSLLSSADFKRMFACIRQYFQLADNAEITVEGNPESLADAEKLQVLHSLGVNRLSMGVQSMHEADLKALGRTHSHADVLIAVQLARQAGFTNIGLDLIWGLPGQTPAAWQKTLEAAIALAPEHISAYGLTLEPGTPLAADVEAGCVSLPSDEEQAVLYEMGAELLEAHGYQQYEISNFCRPNFACRHNQGYWNGSDYLGFGPSAVSTEQGLRRSNPADINLWAYQVRTGISPAPEILTPELRAEERVMLRLRTAEGLDLEIFRRENGYDLAAAHSSLLHALCQAGLAEIAGTRLRLTRRGLLVSNSIISTLLA